MISSEELRLSFKHFREARNHMITGIPRDEFIRQSYEYNDFIGLPVSGIIPGPPYHLAPEVEHRIRLLTSPHYKAIIKAIEASEEVNQ